MQLPPSVTKILKKEFENIIFSKDWMKILLNGRLDEFEKMLSESFTDLYNQFSEIVIQRLSSTREFLEIQKKKAKKHGLKKLVIRPVELQLRTGTKIKFNSVYAKKIPKSYKGDRHVSMLHWQCILKSSPTYTSITTLLSVICPSFEVAKSVIRQMGIKANTDRIRSLSISLGEVCVDNRAKIQLNQNESLAGKRVIVSVDGGRTRTKLYHQENEPKRDQKYDTPWREPKLFVITTIDKNGKTSKQDLPIYDSTFGDDEMFSILEQYLKNLSIELAESVQIIADGAVWIWNRAKALLIRLGVKKEKIIETLDYYHAMEHLSELMIYVDENKKEKLFSKLKQAIWEGKLTALKRLIKRGIPDVVLKDFTPYMYFWKNRERIDYQLFRNDNRLIGSGIIESGIRRVINLRFKAPSSFWYPDNVEKLILMRAIALSGRWNIMLANLQKI